MGDEKGKWLRFEDGLQEGGAVSDNELTYNNRNSYKEFLDQCVNQKPAEERRAILIFLGEKASKRKKDKKVDDAENSARGLLIENIMKSCTINRVDGREFLTVAMVTCKDSDIKNAAFLTESERKAKKKEKVDSAKKFLDEGSRIVDSKEVFWGRRVLLSGQHIFNDVQDTAKRYKKILTLIGNKILIQFAPIIITILYYLINFLQNEETNLCGNVGALFTIIYVAIWGASEYATKAEIKYYRKLDFPVIFFNETGKTKRWMKSYIRGYLKGKKGKKFKKPIFYIGANDFNDADAKLNQFIIPTDNPEWGLICLCKLVRDLADDPWGEIKLKTDYADYDYYAGKRKAPVESKENASTSYDSERIQKFNLWDEEEYLAMMRTKLSEKYWSFCKFNRCKSERMFCPVGSSVYVIYIFNNKAYNIDIWNAIERIKGEINEVIGKYQYRPQIRFWIIIVDEEEQKTIDEIGEIVSKIQREEKVSAISKNMWQIVIQIIMYLARKNDFKNLKKLIQLGEKEIKYEDVKNIINIVLGDDLHQEQTLKLDKEQ